MPELSTQSAHEPQNPGIYTEAHCVYALSLHSAFGDSIECSTDPELSPFVEGLGDLFCERMLCSKPLMSNRESSLQEGLSFCWPPLILEEKGYIIEILSYIWMKWF